MHLVREMRGDFVHISKKVMDYVLYLYTYDEEEEEGVALPLSTVLSLSLSLSLRFFFFFFSYQKNKPSVRWKRWRRLSRTHSLYQKMQFLDSVNKIPTSCYHSF